MYEYVFYEMQYYIKHLLLIVSSYKIVIGVFEVFVAPEVFLD